MSTRTKKLLSFLLVFALVLQMLPMSVFAEEVQLAEGSPIPITSHPDPADSMFCRDNKTEYKAEDVLWEIEYERTETEKHFHLANGSDIAVAYTYPVHYKTADGKYQEIDNRLKVYNEDGTLSEEPVVSGLAKNASAAEPFSKENESTKREDFDAALKALPIDPRVYKNTAGFADVSLAVSAGADRLATLSYGDYSVSLTPQIPFDGERAAESYKAAVSIASVAGQIKELDSSIKEGSFEEKILPKNLSSAVSYDGILNGADLEYIVNETSLKENIVVREAADEYIYSFLLEVGKLTPYWTEMGSIELRDEDDEAIFVIPAGVMTDAKGESSREVRYTLDPNGEGEYILTVTADTEWINAPERAFPVTIDPPVHIQGFYNIETGTIMEYAPDSYSGQVATESLGYYSLNNGSCRMLVRVNNLPDIPENSYIVRSEIYLCAIAYSTIAMDSLRVQAQALQYNSPIYGYWCLSHTWNNCPPLYSDVIDFNDISTAYAFYYWNVTGEALKWYNDPSSNYGICLKATKESEMDSTYCANVGFCSSNTQNDAARPYFVVEYRNCIGLESYYSYQTHGIDRAGTGYIGDYSGQLTLVKDDVISASTVNPVAISHVYNSGYAKIGTSSAIHAVSNLYSSMGVGLGWMLNVQQSITNAGSGYLMYIDGDGTAHYFQLYSGSTYKDEDGLGLTITKSGYNYTLRDRKDNVSYFTNGMLSYMQDANGNRINIVRDNDDVILYVTRQNSGGSVETIASFTYNNAGNIGTITDDANNVTSFYYDSLDQLTSVTHPDGTTVTYTYDGNCKLLSAKDNESGYSMNYEYNANTGKVSKFYEKAGSTVGASVQSDGFFDGVQSYRYCGPDRILNTNDDVVSHSLLDYWGRTFSSYSTNADETLVYRASATRYSVNEGTNAANNRALASSSAGVQSVNLLKLPGIEAPTGVITPWSFSGGGSSAVSIDEARTGVRSMKITRTSGNSTSVFAQTVSGLETNSWYVVSAYVNTGSVSSFGQVTIKAVGNSTYSGNIINWDTSGLGDGWERIYAVGKPNASGSLTLSVQISGIVGSVYLDDFQLEKSLFGEEGTPGSASLLVNGSMADSSAWSTWLPNNVNYVNDSTFGRALHVQGDSYESIDVYQDIPLRQPGNQTYLLSGWAKANAVPRYQGTGRSFSVWVELYYTTGDYDQELHEVEFSTDMDQWQYVALPIVPKHPELEVDSMRVYFTFCFQPNEAWFTNLSLTKEDAQSFKYNSDGELISVTSSENEEQNYTYSGADLISHVTGGNGTFTYEYDNKHNVTKATNDGLSMSVTYDAKGNTSSTALTGTASNNWIASLASYDSTGNRLASQIDARGKTTTYSYDTNISKQTGQPTAVTDANNVTVNSIYNPSNGRAIAVGALNDVYLSYTYTNGRLSALQRSGYIPGSSTEQRQTYNITYNGFGSMTGVSVGTRNLAAYTYGSANGLLQEMSYGNGASVSYDYDKLERISNVYYNNSASPAASYIYSGNGGLGRVTDNVAGKVTDYSYDSLNRLTSMTERYGTYGVQVYLANYDSSNRVSQTGYKVSPAWNGVFRDNRIYGYTYSSSDGSLSTMALPANGQYAYTYDGLKRLTTRSLSLNGNGFLTRGYTYVPGAGTNSTTMLVGGLTNQKGNTTLNSYTYTYDNVGNITAIGGTTPASYTYDSHGQMLTETVNGVTYTYTYDTYGNIRSVSDGTNTYVYTYGDSNWKDLLTAYCGQSITYDQIGNPTHWYNGNNFTWVNGRRLSAITTSTGSIVASYTYDVDGLRQTKTVGGVEHRYVWQGNKLVSEYWDGKELEFFYDESGMPYAFSYKSSSSATPVFYYYVTNLQGDVVKILTASGTEVANYSYNAWGKLLSSSGTMASVNPIRYRGYYFDAESGFYYLQSRYYDPSICRFINADSYASTGQGFLGANMFTYCLNNPICFSDSTGTSVLHDLWRKAEAFCWHRISDCLRVAGYNLTANLLDQAADGNNLSYIAGEGSYASELCKGDADIKQAIETEIAGQKPDSKGIVRSDFGYTIPLGNGDLGASLHRVVISVDGRATGNNLHATITITDTFDYTEFVNPFNQSSLIEGILWAANDIAYIDTKWGLLDPVSVKISYVEEFSYAVPIL